MKKLRLMIALASSMSMGAALAEPGKLYAGISAGRSDSPWMDVAGQLAPLSPGGFTDLGSTRDTAFKLYAGHRLNEHVDVRAGYAYLGKTTSIIEFSGNHIGFSNTTQSVFADVLTRFQPVAKLSLFTKLGVALNQNDICTRVSPSATFPADFGRNKNDYSLAFVPGVGASYDITPRIGVVAEYELYAAVGRKHSNSSAPLLGLLDDMPKEDVSVLSAGLYFHF